VTEISSCRYCPLYCPSIPSPITGYCLAPVIPEFIALPYEDCPLGMSSEKIRGLARLRLLEDHDVRRISFYALSSSGSRSPFFPSLDRLDRYLGGRREDYLRFVLFIDADNIPFYRICIDSDPRVIVT